MTKVYEPSSALSDDSDDDSSTESERERNAPKQLRVPPLPLLLDGKCGWPGDRMIESSDSESGSKHHSF